MHDQPGSGHVDPGMGHVDPGGGHVGLFAAPLAGHVIASPDASIVVTEWTDRGGGEPPEYIAPLHIHHADDEAWYVLEGRLTVRVGEEDVAVPAGGGVLVPRGTVHTFWNPNPEQTRYLLIMTPKIRRLVDLLHERRDMTEDEVAAAFREHDSEFLGWP